MTSVAFAPGGTTVAVGDSIADPSSSGGSTYLWDITTRAITATLVDPGSEGVTSVAFAPGGTTLATADWNGNAYLWRLTRRNA